jgi:hypothetical protein
VIYGPSRQYFFVALMDIVVDCKPGEAFNQVLYIEFMSFYFNFKVLWKRNSIREQNWDFLLESFWEKKKVMFLGNSGK